MRHVFFGLSGGMGPIFRTIPIAEQFKANKVSVSFSVYGDAGISFLQRQGYKVWIDDDPARHQKKYAIQSQPQFFHLDHYYAQMGLLDKTFTETWIRNRIQLLETIKADFVISDMSAHTLIAAKVLGIPSLSITQSCLHPQGKPLHYWGTPPRNLPKVTPVMNEILKSYKLQTIERMEELHQGNVDIIPSIPELDPMNDSKARYAGPISMNLHSPYELDLPLGQPSILVYPGRLQDSVGLTGLHLIEAVIHAFAQSNVTVVLATAETLPKALLRRCSPNIRIIPSFNEAMLSQFDLFIHHGGHGSCLASIVHGVPTLIVPTQMEREFNARQIYELGIGDYMMPRTFTASHLYHLCHYIMEDDYKHKVIELQTQVERRKYRGAKYVYESALRCHRS